ncbi:MAG: L-seryl-tRNA(Sec) selenium transferase [Deltaproteobacteria bacterium]|nr:MAG: L-seryl-tRNA(Sec) selenium transferase [Deltaproteobacteria bacterium]
MLRRDAFTAREEALLTFESLLPLFQKEIALQIQPRLRRVINATGVVIHTNLGRSPLHPAALHHLADIASAYSNLEYDLQRGERGSRYDPVEEILCRLAGAESAMAVNNNAGAVLLVLNALAAGREVIVSRGELVEIGGAFRIPDVMRQSGATLREVGTTNQTHLSDYEKAIGSQTALLLKVHPSNFRVIGFTGEVPLEALVKLGAQHNLPVMNDLGSGCFVDLTRYGLIKEPTVQEVVQTGVDVVTFSGDKLLGGPQAGIILAKKRILDLVKGNPLTRALRIDKMTLAALESTLLLYLDEKRAMKEIPTLLMLTLDQRTLRRRGRRLLRQLSGTSRDQATFALGKDVSQVGGGSLPIQELPSIVFTVKPESCSVNDLEERLRKGAPAVIVRIRKEEIVLDMRTVLDEEIPLLAGALEKALSPVKTDAR